MLRIFGLVYLCLTNRNNTMKIQAKDAKVGMTVTWGVVTLTIQEIIVSHQKNGKEVRTFKGPAIRTWGRGVKPSKYPDYDFTSNSETLLGVK